MHQPVLGTEEIDKSTKINGFDNGPVIDHAKLWFGDGCGDGMGDGCGSGN